ncbi:hypothetical protein [Couchioplanes azureus]|uniref:hypothetical protein n=1 Tax=Couchioplanes caeruleus TaxID=56438 RepID=UPI00166FA419|nr:hypothetical protein [Couchioplanes caeruleus]GGQ39803.1 hypothetical protein GCM10010166_03350 [Couchioplanes caeruleus subsp. azureus]
MQDLPDVFGPLQGGERALWRGRSAVAEYAFDRAASLPRWTLPEATEVLVTDRRIAYAHTSAGSGDDVEIRSGELRWLYPQHIRVQPGSRTPGRAAAVTQIQLVCGGADGSFPALVFAGGDLTDAREADRLANVIRHAIAGFRVENAAKLGLTEPQARMLSRMLIGPEFTNFQGGEGQTVSMLGALPVPRPAPADAPPEPAAPARHAEPAAVPDPRPAGPTVAAHPRHARVAAHAVVPEAGRVRPAGSESGQARHAWPVSGSPSAGHGAVVGGGTGRLPGYRPGRAADEARALQAAAAEQAAHQTEPDLASRAASLAARVAHLVAAGLPEGTGDDRSSEHPPHQPVTQHHAGDHHDADHHAGDHHARDHHAGDQPAADQPTTDLADRAERIRRTAARFAANSAKVTAPAHRAEHESGSHRAEHESGTSPRGQR